MPSAVPTETDADADAKAETITDEALLRRYADRHDPGAFAELANRRAGLVFGVCLRITADRHDAEELTQDCLLQLARKAATIQTSVAGWLHQVATHRALNAVRSRGRRRARETQAATPETEPAEPTWSEVEPLLDEAIGALPDDVREAIILHFLQSLPQEAVAHRLGVHQSTISRRIDRGLNLLRERLTASGAALSAAPLSALLAASASTSNVPNLTEAIGKIALAGAGSGGAGGLLGWLGVSWANAKAWAALAGAVLAPLLVDLAMGGWFAFLAAVLMAAYIAWKRPAWLENLALGQGERIYDNPFYPFRRWTWTSLPRNWRMALFNALMASVLLGASAAITALDDRSSPGVVAMMTFYALIALGTFARIVIRVIRYRYRGKEHREPPIESDERPVDAAGLAQGLCLVAVAPLMIACFTVANVRLGKPRGFTVGLFVIYTIAAVCGFVDSIQNLSRYRRARRISTSVEARPAAPAPPSWGAVGVLVYILLTVVFFTTPALFQPPLGLTSPPREAARQAAMLGYTSPLALVFLSIAIRPLARLRETMRRPLWWFAVTIAALCAILNFGACVVWLLPRG